jgi:antirestriction protein
MSETLDTRQLIEELDALDDRDSADSDDPLDDEERERRDAIRELADAGIEDWEHGATLIPEDGFEDYARELAEDIGAVDPNAAWPATYIDWEAAATALQQDYTSVEFMGVTYYVR